MTMPKPPTAAARALGELLQQTMEYGAAGGTIGTPMEDGSTFTDAAANMLRHGGWHLVRIDPRDAAEDAREYDVQVALDESEWRAR